MRNNRMTKYGRKYGFAKINNWDDFVRLPLSEYQDYCKAVEQIGDGEENVLTNDSVDILQPTSGTSSIPKLIPHTKSAAKEFKSALDVWIVDLFMQRPKLFLGPQYWAISPASEIKNLQNRKVSIGFLDDAEYFGKQQRGIIDHIMAVPAEVKQITDMQTNQYITLLFLLRLKNLRLISVWHPSFLTLLLNAMRNVWPCLMRDLKTGGIDSNIHIPDKIRHCLEKKLKPEPKRAGELMRLDLYRDDLYRAIWPNIQVISCWREGNVQLEIIELEKAFPDVLIQAKGLIATEGVVSIPLGPSQQHVCSITSHVLEFQDNNGTVHPIWDLHTGKSYQVILTTAGGLYRYQIKDRIEVTGFYGQVPCIRFLGRTGIISDFVGEKIHIEHIEKIISEVARQYFPSPRFAMLVPSTDNKNRRYNLLVEKNGNANLNLIAVAMSLESELCSNYHYAHARELGQLKPVVVTMVDSSTQNRYRNFMISKGAVAGTIKFPALCTVRGIEEYLIGISAMS